MNRQLKNKAKPSVICRCNNVSKEEILTAIQQGAQTLNEIFDATNAGVGPCGGSCRRIIAPLLEKALLDKAGLSGSSAVTPSVGEDSKSKSETNLEPILLHKEKAPSKPQKPE